MTSEAKRQLTCAIYTRKSSEEGLEQEFNSLDAQREACEAYVRSQRHEGWRVIETQYDDGGFSGGNVDRPALQRLLNDIRARKVDVIVVYKVDRLTRSLSDFAKIVETFDGHGVSFVSVTQQFNTTTSMGRLTLNVLLSFAQFEREVTGERIRDKIAASRKKGLWMGGTVPIGYELSDQRYVVNKPEADIVKSIFTLYIELGCVRRLYREVRKRGFLTKVRTLNSGKRIGGVPISRGHLYYLLNNRTYLGEAVHKGQAYAGLHEPIVEQDLWDRVQRLLASNRVAKAEGRGLKDPSLLAGFIFDDLGNRLTPSHTVKKDIRHRYYVSQALLQHRPEEAGPIKRLPAAQIEKVVSEKIADLVRQPLKLCDELFGARCPSNTKQRISTAAKALSDLQQNSANHRAFIRTIIQKITVAEDQIEISIDRQALRVRLGVSTATKDTFEIPSQNDNTELRSPEPPLILSINVRLKRSGREGKMLIGDFELERNMRRPNQNMIETIRRAHDWNTQFLAGRSPTEIATDNKLHRGYVSAVMKAAFLAPDIAQAILEGRQPAQLRTKQLLAPLPLEWPEQRRVLGFPPAV